MRKSRSSEMLKQRKQATNQSRRYQLQPRELRVPQKSQDELLSNIS